MSYYGTYQRFGVPLFASRLTLLCAATRALTSECRRTPYKRATSHAFYRQCLEYQQQDQATCIKFRLRSSLPTYSHGPASRRAFCLETVMTNRFKVTAMKYPGFYANREVEADNLDGAVLLAKGLDWSDQNFEPTQDWPPVQSLLVENSEDSRLVDLEPSPAAAIAVLREFVDDVKLAHGTGEGDAIDGTGLDWPDLAKTYWKAVAVLDNQAPVFRQNVFVATYEHKHGTDIRVFRTQGQAEAWRREVADMWWEAEFDDFPRPADPQIDIGEAYFDRMRDRGEEFFSIEASPVE